MDCRIAAIICIGLLVLVDPLTSQEVGPANDTACIKLDRGAGPEQICLPTAGSPAASLDPRPDGFTGSAVAVTPAPAPPRVAWTVGDLELLASRIRGEPHRTPASLDLDRRIDAMIRTIDAGQAAGSPSSPGHEEPVILEESAPTVPSAAIPSENVESHGPPEPTVSVVPQARVRSWATGLNGTAVTISALASLLSELVADDTRGVTDATILELRRYLEAAEVEFSAILREIAGGGAP